jgi:hypothetical protein
MIQDISFVDIYGMKNIDAQRSSVLSIYANGRDVLPIAQPIGKFEPYVAALSMGFEAWKKAFTNITVETCEGPLRYASDEVKLRVDLHLPADLQPHGVPSLPEFSVNSSLTLPELERFFGRLNRSLDRIFKRKS